jgi:CheY-like chemotaxis protein
MSKIMVVDDERSLRMLYSKDLEKDGHTVVTAGSAEECLERLEDERPDLVVLDIRMPGMDGIEAMGRILERRPDLPVVLNSAYLSYRENFLSWTAEAYVVKSSDTGELRSTVGQVLQDRGTHGPVATA